MSKMGINLRNYLQQNHSKLTWKERLQIISHITYALHHIHYSKAIHRDLHSGNILFSQLNQGFEVSDLGFCGPADKPLNSIYGNLPYIAPEVIAGKGTTFASDVYSISMLMWEVSSGQPPFINYENDYNLAMKIINGMRPKIVPETPLEYKELMEQCWDADPTKRPDIKTLRNKIRGINRSYYQSTLNESNNRSMIKKLTKKIKIFRSPKQKINTIIEINSLNTSSRLFTSKIYQFKNLPEPRNATEGNNNTFFLIKFKNIS